MGQVASRGPGEVMGPNVPGHGTNMTARRPVGGPMGSGGQVHMVSGGPFGPMFTGRPVVFGGPVPIVTGGSRGRAMGPVPLMFPGRPGVSNGPVPIVLEGPMGPVGPMFSGRPGMQGGPVVPRGPMFFVGPSGHRMNGGQGSLQHNNNMMVGIPINRSMNRPIQARSMQARPSQAVPMGSMGGPNGQYPMH